MNNIELHGNQDSVVQYQRSVGARSSPAFLAPPFELRIKHLPSHVARQRAHYFFPTSANSIRKAVREWRFVTDDEARADD
jgi:hypothetical protein